MIRYLKRTSSNPARAHVALAVSSRKRCLRKLSPNRSCVPRGGDISPLVHLYIGVSNCVNIVVTGQKEVGQHCRLHRDCWLFVVRLISRNRASWNINETPGQSCWSL